MELFGGVSIAETELHSLINRAAFGGREIYPLKYP